MLFHLLSEELKHLQIDFLSINKPLEISIIQNIAGIFAHPGHLNGFPGLVENEICKRSDICHFDALSSCVNWVQFD
jgi:hypothetical protein